MKTCFMPGRRPVSMAGDARPLRVQISEERIFRLLQTDVLHVEDLQCLDRHSRDCLNNCCCVVV